MNRYAYSRGAAAALGVMASVALFQIANKGFSVGLLTSDRFLFELGMAFISSFPFASFAAFRYWKNKADASER